MAVQTLGQTARFILKYEDTADPPARQLAQAILDTCESDVLLLNDYLPFMGPNGDEFTHYQVNVTVTPTASPNSPPAGGANNGGFHIGNFSQINIHPFSPSGPPITDDFARFLFIAEMSELLMGFYGWNESDSRGEALSRVLAEQFYPAAAYDTQSSVSPAPWVNEWLSARAPAGGGAPATLRPDWINKDEPTDTDQISYGCGIVFINYLRNQLSYSLRDICGAGGTTLADHYKNLTGQTDDPAKRVTDLLDKHFPASGPIKLLNNNPFPLLDGAAREVSLAFQQLNGSSRPTPVSGLAHMAPFFTCPVKDYRYSGVARTTPWNVTATSYGFGQPQFQWKVNGSPLLAPQGQLQVTAGYAVPDPNHPNAPTHASGPFNFSFKITNSATRDGFTSSLLLTNLSFAGDYGIEVTAEVSESVGGEGPASATQSITFNAFGIIYEPQYYIDQAACESAFEKNLRDNVPRLEQIIQIIKTLPDPPPPGAMNKVLEAVDAAREQIRQAAAGNRKWAEQAARYVALLLKVAPQLILRD